MIDALAIIPVVVVAFIATNIDNFMLLVSLLARYRDRQGVVAIAYVAAVAVLCLIGFLIGAAAETAPLEFLGLLGVIPIIIGAVWLVRLFRPAAATCAAAGPAAAGEKSVFAATLMTQLGNGTDTVITFGVLFADSAPYADVLIVLTVAAMAVAFVALAVYAIGHPALGEWVERYGQRVAPFVMIIIGAYVIANTGSDVLPD